MHCFVIHNRKGQENEAAASYINSFNMQEEEEKGYQLAAARTNFN